MYVSCLNLSWNQIMSFSTHSFHWLSALIVAGTDFCQSISFVVVLVAGMSRNMMKLNVHVRIFVHCIAQFYKIVLICKWFTVYLAESILSPKEHSLFHRNAQKIWIGIDAQTWNATISAVSNSSRCALYFPRVVCGTSFNRCSHIPEIIKKKRRKWLENIFFFSLKSMQNK